MDSSNGASFPHFGSYAPTVSGGGGGQVQINPQVEWSPGDGDLWNTTATTALSTMTIAIDDLHNVNATTALDEMVLSYPDLHSVNSAFAISAFQRNYDYGSNSVTQNAVGGRSDWASITNAQGKTNGSNATIAGNIAGARGGQLQLEYNNLPDFTTFGFTVVSAHLDFYTNQAGTLLNNGDLRHQYDVGGSVITLATYTNNQDFTSTPDTFDITSAITSQSTVDSLSAYVRFESAVAETFTAVCDSVHFRLVVTHV